MTISKKSGKNISITEGKPGAAQLVAAEAVVLAETKDHQNWHLIGEVSKKAKGEIAKVLKEAYDEVEHEEDEHYYHTKGWARGLWIESLGMKAGVALNPHTPVHLVQDILGDVDMILIMSVNPGFGAQFTIPFAAER